MPLLPVLAITLPLLGAGGTLVLSPLPRVRPYTRYITLMAVSLTTILLLAFGWMEAVAFVPSLWQPSLLFGATLALQSDATVQPLAVALALVTCSAVLVELSRTEKPNPRLMATLQALLAAGFVALWAANLLTMAVSWAIYDLLQAAGNAAIGGSARTAVRSLIFGNLATLLLWGGALLSGGGRWLGCCGCGCIRFTSSLRAILALSLLLPPRFHWALSWAGVCGSDSCWRTVALCLTTRGCRS
jgi:formate hydrogenlyase subunit 3/multisubunit Na+/H+ antiporter MnhD subunit